MNPKNNFKSSLTNAPHDTKMIIPFKPISHLQMASKLFLLKSHRDIALLAFIAYLESPFSFAQELFSNTHETKQRTTTFPMLRCRSKKFSLTNSINLNSSILGARFQGSFHRVNCTSKTFHDTLQHARKIIR